MLSSRVVFVLGTALLLLTACDRPAPPPAPPAVDPAAIAATVERMQAARDGGQHEAALIYAEEILQKYPDSEPAHALSADLDALRAAAAEERDGKRLAALWTYHAIDAAGGTQYTAYIDGTSDEPMAAPLRLVLRRHPEWGQNSYLLVDDSAGFACSGTCKARLAFDDAPAKQFDISPAEDIDPPAVFIEDDRAMFAAAEQSRTLVLELPLAGGKTRAYRFELGGYQPQRMQPADDTAAE